MVTLSSDMMNLQELVKRYPWLRLRSAVRWIRIGTPINGRMVRLAATRVGRQWLTTEAEFERFVKAQQPQEDSKEMT